MSQVVPPSIVFLDRPLVFPNLVPRVFSFSNMAVENEKTLGTMLLFSFFLLDVDDDFFVPKKKTTTTTTTKTENIHFQR